MFIGCRMEDRLERPYSYRRASIGFKSDALYAGKNPKNVPTSPENPKASRTDSGDTTVGQPDKDESIMDADTPTTAPTTPPTPMMIPNMVSAERILFIQSARNDILRIEGVLIIEAPVMNKEAWSRRSAAARPASGSASRAGREAEPCRRYVDLPASPCQRERPAGGTVPHA